MGGTRWAILALLFTARIGLGLQFQTLNSVSDQLIAGLGLNYAQIGTLVGLFMLPGMFLALPVGFAGRYLPDRLAVSLGLATLAAGGGLAAIADGFGWLAAARIICGAGFVISNIFFTKMIADWFAGREMATAMGFFVMSWPLGIAMGQIGHGWLAVTFSWRAAFLAATLYCLAGAILVLLLYRRPETLAATQAPPAQGLASGRLNRREFKLTVLAGLVWGFFNAAYIVYLSFAPRMLMANGFDQVEALTIISLASWVMLFSGAICGQITDRTGKSDQVIVICMSVGIGCFLLLPFTDLSIPLSLIFGLVAMSPAGAIMALTAEAMAAEKRAIGVGLFFTVFYLTTAITPIAAGHLYDITATPYVPLLLGATLFALTILANVIFRRAQGRPAPIVLSG